MAKLGEFVKLSKRHSDAGPKVGLDKVFEENGETM